MEAAAIGRVREAVPLLLQYPAFRWDYDREADVLYITFVDADATDSDITDDDIVLRYRGEELIGVTVMHASVRRPLSAAK